jgi:hypothetical protein
VEQLLLVEFGQAMKERSAAPGAPTIDCLGDAPSDAFTQRVNQERADQLHQQLDEEVKYHPGIMALDDLNEKKGKSS